MLFNSLMLIQFRKPEKAQVFPSIWKGTRSATRCLRIVEDCYESPSDILLFKTNKKKIPFNSLIQTNRAKDKRSQHIRTDLSDNNKLVQLLQPSSTSEAFSMMSEDKMIFRGFLGFRQLFHFLFIFRNTLRRTLWPPSLSKLVVHFKFVHIPFNEDWGQMPCVLYIDYFSVFLIKTVDEKSGGVVACACGSSLDVLFFQSVRNR